MNTGELISSLSLAICSVLLSLGGFLVVLQKSRCKNINCCGGLIECTRREEVIDIRTDV